MEEKQSNGLAIASMVLGIVAIVLSCVPYICYGAWVLAIVGIVLAAKAKRVSKSGMATAGLVCSIISLVISGIAVIIVALGVSLLALGA